MYVVAYFAESGVPKTGLSPTLEIYDILTEAKLVDGSAMTEIADGFYKYNFLQHAPNRAYDVICDSVTLTGTEQYATVTIDIVGEVVEQKPQFTSIWEEEKKQQRADNHLAQKQREDEEIMTLIEQTAERLCNA